MYTQLEPAVKHTLRITVQREGVDVLSPGTARTVCQRQRSVHSPLLSIIPQTADEV
jgi:hypothetical protein